MQKAKRGKFEIEQLRSFKDRSQWPYRKIAGLMKVHHQTIYFWLHNEHVPSQMALSRLRSFLDIYAY